MKSIKVYLCIGITSILHLRLLDALQSRKAAQVPLWRLFGHCYFSWANSVVKPGAGSRLETVTDAEGDAGGIGVCRCGDAARRPGIGSQTKVNKFISQDVTHENPSLAPFL